MRKLNLFIASVKARRNAVLIGNATLCSVCANICFHPVKKDKDKLVPNGYMGKVHDFFLATSKSGLPFAFTITVLPVKLSKSSKHNIH